MWATAAKEFHQLRRDRRMLAMLIAIPLLLDGGRQVGARPGGRHRSVRRPGVVGRRNAARLRVEVLFNPDLTTSVIMVPGLISRPSRCMAAIFG
ncbi:hypothetical protein [Kutzneria buriramensis]|uniref:Uncharacterized protein n=1 Tax=Kutzneria buriramensis TaxID=1045776 RepID=A0A3E0GY09_9PSEU|nr:hypothetical protein [Kutzneria buriramensis]REH34828.1 hypothetical protein BCF44_119104 [Kutzneria buriramensis]